jgi:hypothetical protein
MRSRKPSILRFVGCVGTDEILLEAPVVVKSGELLNRWTLNIRAHRSNEGSNSRDALRIPRPRGL